MSAMNELSVDTMSALAGGSELVPSVPDANAILDALLRTLGGLLKPIPINPWRFAD
jgi:hypothetical protein